MVHYIKEKVLRLSNKQPWALRHQKLVSIIAIVIAVFVMFGILHIYNRNKISKYVELVKSSRSKLITSLDNRSNKLKTFDSDITPFNINFDDKQIVTWYENTDKEINLKIKNLKDIDEKKLLTLTKIRKSEEDVKNALEEYNNSLLYLNRAIVSFPTNLYKKDLKEKKTLVIKDSFRTNF